MRVEGDIDQLTMLKNFGNAWVQTVRFPGDIVTTQCSCVILWYQSVRVWSSPRIHIHTRTKWEPPPPELRGGSWLWRFIFLASVDVHVELSPNFWSNCLTLASDRVRVNYGGQCLFTSLWDGYSGLSSGFSHLHWWGADEWGEFKSGIGSLKGWITSWYRIEKENSCSLVALLFSNSSDDHTFSAIPKGGTNCW